MILEKKWQFGSDPQKETIVTGALENAVRDDAPWAGEDSLRRASASMLMDLNFVPEAPGSQCYVSKLPEEFRSSK